MSKKLKKLISLASGLNNKTEALFLADSTAKLKEDVAVLASVVGKAFDIKKDVRLALPEGWHPAEHKALLEEVASAAKSISEMNQDVEFSSARGKIASLMLSKAESEKVDFSKESDKWGWIKSVLDWRRSNHPYSFAQDITTIPDHATLAVVGDWGTNLYGAHKSVKSINGSGAHMFLHLGDIYYSGLVDEVKKRFLAPCSLLTNIGFKRACNGNHEMYSGGDGYFENVFEAFKQKSSFFILQNSHFLLFGLDTAYDEDFDLKDKILAGNMDRDEFKLLTAQFAQVKQYASHPEHAKKDIVFFSHHYPFTILDTPQNKILELAREVLGEDFMTKRLRAWCFGHEHQCVLYDSTKKAPFAARCYGNGGVPQARNQAIVKKRNNARTPGFFSISVKHNGIHEEELTGKALDGENLDIVGYEREYIPHTYTLLKLKNDQIMEEIYLSGTTKNPVYSGPLF